MAISFRPNVPRCLSRRLPDAADPEDAALLEKNLPPGVLGRTGIAGRIEYRAKSAEGKVRDPFFKRLRDDL